MKCARLVLGLSLSLQAFAQTSNSGEPLTLAAAVQAALRNYPSIRVSQEQVNAASAAIRLAQTAYLPRVDALAQVNRATRNNVFGTLLPQSTVPSISGPVIGSHSLGSVWGSAVGGLVTWEPFDFGLRGANVAAAEASRARAEAAVRKTQFEIAVAAADAYLTVVAAEETVRTAQAGVARAETVQKSIAAQVLAELRPGADQSRAEAEVAAARTQLIQAEQAVELAKVTLALYTGMEAGKLHVMPGAFQSLPPDTPAGSGAVTGNPVIAEQNAVVEQARAELRTLERSYFPKFYLQGAASARGTGAELNGARLGGLNGLAPNVQNYAVGVSVTIPLMELPAVRAREEAKAAEIRQQTARGEQLAAELRAQWNRSVATLAGARRVAANTPVQVKAAQAALDQATARYQAGLSNVDETAAAQRLLTAAEIDNVLARLSVWRSLLGLAAAAGDIQPFVAEVSR